MLVLPGSSALSDARFELLATEMAALGGECVLREVVHAYVIDVPPGHSVMRSVWRRYCTPARRLRPTRTRSLVRGSAL